MRLQCAKHPDCSCLKFSDDFMAEKAVSDIKDSGKELLEKLSEIEVFKRENQSTIQKVMDDLGRAPAPKQMAVGGVAGWAAGYVTMKAGKMAATAIGGTLILIQIAHHKGYIKVTTLHICLRPFHYIRFYVCLG